MFESFGKGNRVTVYNDIRTYCTLLHSGDPVLAMHLNLHFEDLLFKALKTILLSETIGIDGG